MPNTHRSPGSRTLIILALASLLGLDLVRPEPGEASALALVPNSGDGTVSVLDSASDTIVATIDMGVTFIQGAASSPTGDKVYVTNVFGGANVVVIDTATNSVTRTTTVGSSNFGIAVHPDGSRIYVPSQAEDSVYVVDAATLAVTSVVPVGDEPFARGRFITPDFVRGDGTLDPIEGCDDGNTTAGDCCAPSCQLESCDDGVACTRDSCVAPSGCVNHATPDPACVVAAKGLVLSKDTAGKEKFIAKLKKGGALAQTDFGNPTVSDGTAYTACIYDDSDTLAAEVTLDRAGTLCDLNLCWRAIGGSPPGGKGYKYKDKTLATNGIRIMALKAGTAGKSSALMKGKGTNVPAVIPAAVLGTTRATLQIIGDDAPQCLSASLNNVKKSEADQFKAK